MSPAENAVRLARMVQMACIAATVLYAVVLFQLPHPRKPVQPLLVPAFIFAAVSTVGVGVFLRSTLVFPSAEKISADSQDAAALIRWRTGIIASFSCAESVALMGFLLKFLGVSWNMSIFFFVAAILLLLAWSPHLDVQADL